ncbi:MAG: phosphoglycerate kinase [Candidatus Falkowbacteria bacterium]
MNINSIRKVKHLTGKKVLLRVDFNVPIENGKIKDEYKIIQTLPTIRFLLRHGCKVIIITHLGQPGGQKNEKFTVKPIARRLGVILNMKIEFIDGCIGLSAGTAIGKMEKGEIVILENLRFEAGEEKNTGKFAKELAKYADIYVNDAFGVSHRAQASLSAIKNYLPAYAGLLLEKEVTHLEKAKHSADPLILIVGGAKIKTKIKLIEKFKNKAFRILLGGALANNFFKAHGLETGRSLVDEESVAYARKLGFKNLVLPIDVIAENGRAETRAKSINKIEKDEAIFDIGPETVRLYAGFIKRAATIIWNGPMGRFEDSRFRHGTLAVARLVASRSTGRAFGLVGGGETVEALKMTKMIDYVDWVSTGGGATLTYLEGGKMPGLAKILG